MGSILVSPVVTDIRLLCCGLQADILLHGRWLAVGQSTASTLHPLRHPI